VRITITEDRDSVRRLAALLRILPTDPGPEDTGADVDDLMLDWLALPSPTGSVLPPQGTGRP